MKCYLQSALNDEFDPQERRITIDEDDMFLNKYIFTSGEDKPKFLGTMFLRTSEEYEGTGEDFTVNMHLVKADKHDVEALIDFYKLDGPRYKIINFGLTITESQDNI